MAQTAILVAVILAPVVAGLLAGLRVGARLAEVAQLQGLPIVPVITGLIGHQTPLLAQRGRWQSIVTRMRNRMSF